MFNNATVPVALGNVIVASPVGFAAVRTVSYVFAEEPSNVIFPLASVMELAPSAVPEINVVDAKEVSPAIVEAVAPRETLVPPIVTAELAKLLLAIEDPVVNTVPVSSGKVMVRVAVGSVTVRVVPLASPVAPLNKRFPLAIVITFEDPVPLTNVAEVKDVNPVNVP